MQKPRGVVGVDCGEQKHRIVMIDETGARVAGMWVENDLAAIHRAFEELASSTEAELLEVVIESIGSPPVSRRSV